jgi:hypothetical protein
MNASIDIFARNNLLSYVPYVDSEDGLEKSVSVITCIMWTIGSLWQNCPNARILLIQGYIPSSKQEKKNQVGGKCAVKSSARVGSIFIFIHIWCQFLYETLLFSAVFSSSTL